MSETQPVSKENIERMRKIHSDFVAQTKADPALAQDLLDATEWNMAAALEAYKGLSVTYIEQTDTDKHTTDDDDATITGLLSKPSLSSVDETAPLTDITYRPKSTKRPRAKGLGHVAEEIEDMFIKVAVTESKLKAGAEKKEKVFDQQFFTHSFLHPNLTQVSDDLRMFIQSDIIERSHRHTLTKAGRLNWWSSTGKLPVLEPLATTGDGNCLLHAASLYMWGLPDSYLILRTHLHRILTVELEKDAIQRRWRYVTSLRNQEAGGLVFSEEEWEFEWSEMVRIATNKPRRRPTTDSLRRYSTLRTHYESLEEIHVFAMAHVLRRPIIVVADEYIRDANGEPFAPIYFGGIYLPLECSPSSCYNSPLILAFDSSHFSPLVATRDPVSTQTQQKGLLRHLPSRQDTMMPLVTPDGSLLPLPFVYDPKTKNVSEKWAKEKCQLDDFPDEIRVLLESYLDIRWIQLNIGAKTAQEQPVEPEGFQGKVPKFRFPAAMVSVLGEPEYQSVLVAKYLENAEQRMKVAKEKEEKMAAQKAKQEEEYKRIQASRPVPCKSKDCSMFGTASSNGYCSRCYAQVQQETTDGQQKQTPPSDNDNSKPLVSYPNSWEIVLPDVIADTTAHDDNDGGIKLLSQTTNEDTTSTTTDEQSPSHKASSSPPKSPIKVSSSKPPQKVPNPPPRSPSKSRSINPAPLDPLPSRPGPPSRPPPDPVTTHQAPFSNPPTTRPPPSSTAVNKLPKAPPPTRPAPPPSRSTGYSRDNIQPLNSHPTSGRAMCVGGCGFYGSKEFNGMCSQCHKNKSNSGPSITQV